MREHTPPPWSHRPPWQHTSTLKRRFLLGRMLLFFLPFFIFFLLGVGAVAGALLGYWDTRILRPGLGLLVACLGLPVVVGMLFAAFGWSFRRFALPLAEVMSAADAVAEGDFSVRVTERGPGELRRLAHSFNRMTAELERAGQQRRNLTADVAHELRNPLHIIQGNLEGMIDGVYAPTPDNLNNILDETHQLSRLVEDLQTLSLAESGQLPLHPAPLDAAELLQDAAAGFSAAAATAGVSLTVLPAPGPLPISADEGRLAQVLDNLLANALRHTPAGGSVTLEAAPIPGGVRLAVSDTGPGIPPEDLPYVFDRFWRGDRARRRQPGSGSGLGLAIARQLVQAHGGQIRALSEPGQGARFEVDLPG